MVPVRTFIPLAATPGSNARTRSASEGFGIAPRLRFGFVWARRQCAILSRERYRMRFRCAAALGASMCLSETMISAGARPCGDHAGLSLQSS